MRYALLIYEQPGAYDRLSDDERAGDHRRVLRDPRRPAGRRRRAPAAGRHGHDGPRRRRRAPDHRRPVRRHEGGLRRLVPARGRRPRRRARDRRARPGGADGRLRRGPPARGAARADRRGLPRRVGPRRSPSWSASSATSTSPRKPPRRRSRSRRSAGRATARRSNPGAWLVTTARNRAIDRLRRERTLAAKTRLLDAPEPAEDDVTTTATDPRRAPRARSSPAATRRSRPRRRSR